MGTNSGHGGKREGAGRPVGAKATKSAKYKALIPDDPAPLDILLAGMRHAAAEGDVRVSTNLAKDAAPYCHPRLSAIAHGSTDELRKQAKPEPRSALEVARRVGFLFRKLEKQRITHDSG